MYYKSSRSRGKRSKSQRDVTTAKKIAKSSKTSPRIVQFQSLLQSLNTWHSMYYKSSRSRGKRSKSQRDVTPAKKLLSPQKLRRGLFDFSHWYRVWSRETGCTKMFKVKCQRSGLQSGNVVWSPNHCSLLWVRGAEFNGDVRILIRSWEPAVCVHAQYNIGQKTADNDWRDVRRPRDAMHSQPSHFILLFRMHKNHIEKHIRVTEQLASCWISFPFVIYRKMRQLHHRWPNLMYNVSSKAGR